MDKNSHFLDFILITFVDASEGMKFGPHPLLDRIEQLHTADSL